MWKLNDQSQEISLNDQNQLRLLSAAVRRPAPPASNGDELTGCDTDAALPLGCRRKEQTLMLPQTADLDAVAKSRHGCSRKEQTLMLPQRADMDAAAKSRLGCCHKEQALMLPQRAGLDVAAKSRL